MKKTFKRLTITLIALCFIAAAGLITFIHTLDPNQYKPQLTRLIKQTTGYQVTFNGQLKFSLLPSLRLEANQVTLSKKYALLAKLPHLSANLSLMALLHNKIDINKIFIEAPIIDIDTSKNETPENIQESSTGLKALQAAEDLQSLEKITLKSFEVKHATLIIKQSNQTIRLRALDFLSQNANLHQPFNFLMSSDISVQGDNKDVKASLQLKGQVTLKLQKLRQHDLLDSIEVNAKLLMPQIFYNKIKAQNLLSQLNYQNGIANFKLNHLQAYRGLIDGHLNYQITKQQINAGLNLKTINVGELSLDLNQTKLIDGNLSSQLTLNTSGRNITEKINHLNGQLVLKIDDGSLNTIDINALVQSINTIVAKKRSLKQYLALSLQQFSDKKDFNQVATPFDFLTTTLKIKQGIARTDELKVHTKTLLVEGSGELNLIRQTANFTLKAGMINPLGPFKYTMELLGGAIPFSVSGPFTDLKTQPNFGFILEKLKNKLLSDEKANISGTINQLKQKLPNLNDLF